MKIEKIKPIPKYILAEIKKQDKKDFPKPNGYTRYYAYLTTNDKELVKVTVAVKNKYSKWYYKQCAVHGVHSDKCFVMDMGYSIYGGYIVGWNAEGLTDYPKYYEYKEWWECGDKWYDPYAPIINTEYLAKYPEYKYSAYDLYNCVDILQYLRLYEKYPQTEYIVKLGLSNYASSKQILTKVEKDKKFRKWLSTNREELKTNTFYVSTVLNAYKENKPLKEVQMFEQAKKDLAKDRCFRPIRELFGSDLKKYFYYVAKQQISNRLYLDYLNACNYIGLDMSEEKNRFPHDFNRWHDIRIDEYHTAKAIKDEQERKELYDKFALIADKYSNMQHDKKGVYMVVIAKSPADLVKEGDTLNHCVGRMNYDQKFIREETLIFFVRNKELPEVPFVTVEYSIKKKKILQCYAKGNTPPNDDTLKYINKVWLPYANKALKKIA